MVIDPRINATAYDYNQRGQVTHVQHQDYTYTQSAYNLDGTLAWTADENHPGAATDPNQRTRYTYDKYKRVLTITNPAGETTTNWYGLNPITWGDELLHTTNNVKYTLSPTGKNVVFGYDENLRKTYQAQALSTADEAWTWFWYDQAGNLTTTQDPRGHQTKFGYDERNRKIWMNDPIAADRNTISDHTMDWVYDGVGNKLKETRADDAFRSWEYDIPNRITRAIDWRMSTSEPAITTTYTRNMTSTLETTTDAKNAVYTFEFDALHRKISETYPMDANGVNRTEQFWYDVAGNLVQYKNPGVQYEHTEYDSRNRPYHSYWTGSAGQDVVTPYDAASRVTSITTNNGGTTETIVAFGYDDANRKVWEDQTLTGYPTRRVQTPRDFDGNRTRLEISTGSVLDYGAYYGYNERNQLAHIYWDDQQTPWINYTYDEGGNMTTRQAVLFGVNDSVNAPSAYYDGLNRPTVWENTKAGDVPFARSWYQYDNVGREVATWRDEDGTKGERFTYNPTNQLTDVSYRADQVWEGPGANPGKTQQYVYTTDLLNRSSVTNNGVVSSYGSNPMNQYASLSGYPVQYDGNFNLYYVGGWQYDYDAQSRLLAVTNNSVPQASFVYDGLGRCVKRTLAGVTTVITYDDWKPILEWGSPTQLLAWNAYGAGPDEILWRNQSGVGYLRYHTDRHGNVTAVLDMWGTVIERYSYDAFGAPTITYSDNSVNTHWSQGSRVGNRFMFQGREYINEIGLYDYRHRFYDPGLGRFYQSDPMGLQTEGVKLTAGQKALFSTGGQAPDAFASSEMNLYRYCGDDPVDRNDPTGLIWESEGFEYVRNYSNIPNVYIATQFNSGGTGVTGATGVTFQRLWINADVQQTATGKYVLEFRDVEIRSHSYIRTYEQPVRGDAWHFPLRELWGTTGHEARQQSIDRNYYLARKDAIKSDINSKSYGSEDAAKKDLSAKQESWKKDLIDWRFPRGRELQQKDGLRGGH